MTTHWTERVCAAGLALSLGCSASSGINVGQGGLDASVAGSGGSAGAAGFGGSAGVGGSDNALTAHITEPPSEMAIDVIAISCDGACKQVLAVAAGGNAPYSFTWSDGVTTAGRELCADDATTFTVTVTDTAVSMGEFPYPGQSTSASVTAQVLSCPPDAGAQSMTVAWAEWTQWVASSPNLEGAAQATITRAQDVIAVRYTGEVTSASAMTGATNVFTPESTWTSATVGNGPPAFGHVAVNGIDAYVQRITFSQPVRNPLLAVWSVGFGSLGMPMEIELGQDAVILSTGPNGYGLPGDIMQTGRRLRATEGNGVLEMQGTFSEITFTVPVAEPLNGHFGLTVGVRE